MCPENITDELLFESQRLLSSVPLTSKPIWVETALFLGILSSWCKRNHRSQNIVTLISNITTRISKY